MSEPDLEKARRRSARVYVRPDKLTPEELDQRLAVVARYFPSDEDDDSTAPAPRARKRRGAARRAKELSVDNPLESSEKAMRNYPEPHDGAGYNEMRTSAPITGGHQASSTGDHGTGQGRNSFLAAHHPDLRQSNTSFDQVLARLRTVAGDDYGDRAITYTPGAVALRMFDAAGQAGHYHGMQPVDPNPLRPDWHQSRGSATPANGGHSLSGPASRPPMAAKSNSELRADIKRHLFPGSGGAR